ncbi:acyl carrier protein [Phytohabitans houttuyneae]|uniref:Uncharacterized protein n=1 Tax=Phytohabitans houttuyneae TaxID=1076126 RepID=A0A6V8KES8_9ACTN|nr:acyl carrier protein [Phytohabitans houttuyneae]GFJ83723.1 hypothetical protein Phou_079030 [Phytohabitans houttuyneae]
MSAEQPVASDAVEDEIARFVAEKTGTLPDPSQDLFATGLANSMFALELVVFLERSYAVTVAGADLQLPNFATVASMATLVGRLRAEEAADGDA